MLQEAICLTRKQEELNKAQDVSALNTDTLTFTGDVDIICTVDDVYVYGLGINSLSLGLGLDL